MDYCMVVALFTACLASRRIWISH